MFSVIIFSWYHCTDYLNWSRTNFTLSKTHYLGNSVIILSIFKLCKIIIMNERICTEFQQYLIGLTHSRRGNSSSLRQLERVLDVEDAITRIFSRVLRREKYPTRECGQSCVKFLYIIVRICVKKSTQH